MAALCVDFRQRQVPEVQVGQVAAETWIAPSDYVVEDDASTLSRRVQAVQEQGPVFDLDPNILASVEAELRDSFARGRELLSRAKPHDRASDPDSLSQQLDATLPHIKSQGVARILARQLFSRELENQLVGIVRQSYGGGIMSSRENLSSLDRPGVVLRNSATREEKTLRNLDTLRDLRAARSAVRQKGAELIGLSPSDRPELVQYLESLILPNISYNISETDARKLRASERVDAVAVQIKKGRTLIRRGEKITEHQRDLLSALREVQDRSSIWGRFTGVFLLAGCFLYLLWRYFIFYQTRHRKIRNHYVLLALVLVGLLGIARAFVLVAVLFAQSFGGGATATPSLFYYLIPAALGAMLVILLVDMQVAIFFSIIASILLGVQSTSLQLTVYSVVGSLAAVYALNQYRERSALIRAGSAVAIVNLFSILALNLSLQESLPRDVWIVQSASGVASGLVAAMLASLCLPILESVFNITTDIRLLELSNLNQPILRKLALEAPGTYHHSILVGTLAEAAAEAIHANSLLARVGAYYHGIGKIRKPEYYVENQAFCGNKHEKLSPNMSSLIIASHVKDGLEIAEELKIPKKICDLIPQHHGTRLMTYFYQKARDEMGDKNLEINESDFRYPGPKPQTKEAAILMISDQIEAASRTLVEPNPAQVRAMIRRLINASIEDGQLDECDITLKELDLMIDGFQRILSGIYHHRIVYPGYDFNKDAKGPARPVHSPENTRIQ
ncbi:MAG: HD family phosphohydrolase [Acidobacteriota bacterium]